MLYTKLFKSAQIVSSANVFVRHACVSKFDRKLSIFRKIKKIFIHCCLRADDKANRQADFVIIKNFFHSRQILKIFALSVHSLKRF